MRGHDVMFICCKIVISCIIMIEYNTELGVMCVLAYTNSKISVDAFYLYFKQIIIPNIRYSIIHFCSKLFMCDIRAMKITNQNLNTIIISVI